jgi:hypothetical protein
MDRSAISHRSHERSPDGSARLDPFARRPPIPAMCVGSMSLILASGVYLASHLPRRAPLGPAVGLVAASGVALVAAVVLLVRQRDFAWETFFVVVKWSALAYAIIAGLLEYVFVFDGTRGSMLVLLTLSLLVFAVDIPLLLGFSVARFQPGATRS